MKIQSTWLRFLFLIFLGLVPGCSTATQVQSSWRDKEIASVGQSRDWVGQAVFYDEKNHLTMNVLNDNDALYLRISTFDRMLQQTMLHPGITLWFDPAGGQEKAFGIRFPAGLPATPIRADMGRPGVRKPEGDLSVVLSSEGLDEVELLSKGKERGMLMLISELEPTGLSLKITMDKNILFYELKIPLRNQSALLPFYLSDSGRQCIGIGIFTDGAGGEMPSSPSFGHGGGRPHRPEEGGPGGMPPLGMGRRKMPDPLRIWTQVRLADEPDRIVQ